VPLPSLLATLQTMCGRFTMSRRDAEELALELGVPADSLRDYRPRYNIAPTDQHWIVRSKYEQRELLPALWGLVNSWAKDKKRAAAQINARAETLATRSAFREAFEKRRCVVPADGFFEWTGPKTARQPLWYHRPDGGLLLFAGLYESWQPKPDTWERTFTIVTTDANSLVGRIHDRMPVILTGDAIEAWLFAEQDAGALRELLVPAPEHLLVATPVSQRANSVKNDDASVLEEVSG
jgi:putative SOS response-associated peptidase YedK